MSMKNKLSELRTTFLESLGVKTGKTEVVNRYTDLDPITMSRIIDLEYQQVVLNDMFQFLEQELKNTREKNEQTIIEWSKKQEQIIYEAINKKNTPKKTRKVYERKRTHKKNGNKHTKQV